MNKQSLAVRNVIELAAREIGGAARLIEWVKESEQNERIFWSQMWIKLLPVQVQGSGEHGELELNVISPEDLARRLEARGLPVHLFGADKPVLQVEGNGAETTSRDVMTSSNENRDDEPPEGSRTH